MSLTIIRKRNGTVMPFEESKITNAVNKAFLAVTGNDNQTASREITELSLERLNDMYRAEDGGVPYVEQVQDVVEQAIMDTGHYDVAKHYILYRHERAMERALARQEELKRIEEGNALIITRNGKKERFSEKVLKTFLEKISHGYEKEVSVTAVIDRVKMEIYDGIEAGEFMKAVTLSLRSMIEIDPAYSYVAARSLMYSTLKETGEELTYDTYTKETVETIYKKFFLKMTKMGVEDKIYDARLLDFDLEKLATALDPMRDDLFQYLGMQQVVDRYLVRNIEKGNMILELPQTFWMRVAMGLSILEENKTDKAIEFYNLMSTLRLIPSTPTLFQAGTTYPQLSSCFLNLVEDDLHHIFKSYSDNAQMSKYSGGVATDWTNIRSTGAIVKKTRIESNGLIPFLKIANDVTVTINRSGRRRGAVCVYLETWHYDIEEYLEAKKNTGDERRRLHDMNTANWVPDLFMERVQQDADWTLFSPNEVPELHETYGKKFREHYMRYEQMAKEGKIRIHKTIKAKELYKRMIGMLFETGHPWITFKDPCNLRSPQDHVGVIHNSNLCTEITLNNSAEETAVCNLSSINLPKHFVNGKIDIEMLKNTIHTGIRMLDNTVDINFYPVEEGKTSNLRHRPLGLGIMGFADALYELGIAFDSAEALKFADENQEFISYHAILASSQLAKERGAYTTYKGSKWDRGILPADTLDILESERGMKINVPRGGRMDWTPVRESIKMYGMRNSNTMAIAPTATISNIAGSSPCIEPYYKNIYVKSNMSGEFTMINDYLVKDLKALGMWDTEMLAEIKMNEGSVQNITRIPSLIRAKYKETFEIHHKDSINLAAYRGKWIDQSQSLNLYYRGTSGKDIADMYMYAFEMGLKTTYYLRTLAASGIESSTGDLRAKAKDTPTAESNSIPSNISIQSAVVSPIQHSPVVNVSENKIATENVLVNQAEVKPAYNSTGAGESTMMVNGKEMKICKILDPDCEACQ
jgi:ribonucleoside-diphosphate reductase alpha chain